MLSQLESQTKEILYEFGALKAVVAEPHLNKVLNNERPVLFEILEKIEDKERVDGIDQVPTFDEFEACINSMANDKAG